MKRKPKRVFSCGIGTGWPIEEKLHQNGIIVDGCDLAEKSVIQAQQTLNNEEGIYVGTISDVKNPDSIYDLVYCIRASWCIPDFMQCIERMLNMCKDDGTVIFDIMAVERIKPMKDIVINKYLDLVGIEKDYVPRTCYYSIFQIKSLLSKKGYSYKIVTDAQIGGEKNIAKTMKVFFIVSKKGK